MNECCDTSPILVPKTISQIEVDTNSDPTPTLYLNAWSTQNIVYELVINYMLANPPETLGFNFNARYDRDRTKSGILVDIAYNWDSSIANKRPAIFIQRGDWDFKHPTMGQSISFNNIAESEEERMSINLVPVIVKVIATPVGFAEQLAEYVRQAFIYYQKEIQRDFKFRRFRITEVSKPQKYVDATDYFAIMISIEVAFDEGWVIKGDDLKLKTVGRVIFDSVTSKLISSQ